MKRNPMGKKQFDIFIFGLIIFLATLTACTNQRYFPLIEVNKDLEKIVTLSNCKWRDEQSRYIICTVKPAPGCNAVNNKQIVAQGSDYQGWVQFQYDLEEITDSETGRLELLIPVNIMYLKIQALSINQACKVSKV